MTLTMTDTFAMNRTGGSQLRRMMRDEPRMTTLGLILAAALIPLLAAMLLDARTFQGEDVWLKPVKFLVALSLYTLTLGLFARWMPAGMTDRRPWRIYSSVVVLCVLAEMAWIGGAAFLGIGSHFNVSSPVMAVLYPLMGVFAVTLTSASLVMGVAIARNAETGLPPAVHLSLWLGLVLTFALTVPVAGTLAQGAGHFVGTPSTGATLPFMGWSREVGDLRVAHFFAAHAMHALPIAGLAATALLPRAAARYAVWLAAAAYGALVIFTFVQALDGRPFLPWLG